MVMFPRTSSKPNEVHHIFGAGHRTIVRSVESHLTDVFLFFATNEPKDSF